MEISYASSSAADVTAGGGGGGSGGRQVKLIPVRHPDPDLSSFSSSSLPIKGCLAELRQRTLLQWVELLFPSSRWIRTYKWRECLQSDLMAGVTVGTMLVPQAMSYAKLAGLQPIYGLYSSFIPLFVYAIFGSSRQLAVGPVALVSLLVSNALSGIVDPHDKLYTELATLLAFMVGVMECIMGLLRLGWLIRFISHSVISGFTTASAVVIALSQAKYFLGYNIVRSTKIVPLMKSIAAGESNFSWPPFVMGTITLVILLLMKYLGKSKNKLRFLRAAGPLTAVILGTTFVKLFRPSSISVVGEIPKGLPAFSVPKEFNHVKVLMPTVFLITGVAILESVGIAKAMAARNGYELDSNQELFGLGLANICGSFFSAYPTTGGFSRSAVNNDSGAKTGLAGVFTGIIMGCVLFILTPLFTDVPQCVLAAIVISAVIGLVDYEEAILLWHINKKDFLLWTIACLVTLFLGIEIGVLVGVVVSLAFVIHESANPHIAVLGRLPGTTIYRNVQQYPESYTYSGIVIVRVDAPIYFANVGYIRERLQELVVTGKGSTVGGSEAEKVHFVIIEMDPVTYIDSTGVQALKDLHYACRSHSVQLAVVNPNHKVWKRLTISGVLDLVGKGWHFVRVHDAVQMNMIKVIWTQKVNPLSDEGSALIVT
ncbi:unnamed protein product [Victoria cruziana]